MKTVFLVRCEAFDTGARHVATSLSAAGAEVIIVVDERRSVADTGDYRKISINDQVLAERGLSGLPDNWGSFCGDVWYYIAAPYFPEATHFCLVESDVAFAGDVATQFVQTMEKDPTDLLAVDLGHSDPPPKFSRGLRRLGRDPHVKCFFPVTRCSAGAIKWMYDLRRESIDRGAASVINDEAVLGSAILTGDYTHQSLNSLLPELFSATHFRVGPPQLFEAIMRGEGPAGIRHPAIPLDLILRRIRYFAVKSYNRYRLRRVLPMASDEERVQILAALDAKEAAEAAVALPQDRFAVLARALSLSERIRVLDVGANPLIEGDAPYGPLLRAGLAEVYGFEPQPEALAALNARKSALETYFGDAVGDGAAATLHMYRAQGFTSLYPVDYASSRHLGFGGGTKLTGTLDLVTRRLDDIAEIPPVDLLKIDVQGAETQIIAHGREKLAKALVVITEMRMFPIYQGEPRFGDLAAELHAQGFEFLRFVSLKHVALSRRHRGSLRRSEFAQAVDGDAIFVRDLRNMATFDDASLKKLAVIADGVIDNADLVVSVLEVLEDRGAIPATLIPDYLASLPAGKKR